MGKSNSAWGTFQLDLLLSETLFAIVTFIIEKACENYVIIKFFLFFSLNIWLHRGFSPLGPIGHSREYCYVFKLVLFCYSIGINKVIDV